MVAIPAFAGRSWSFSVINRHMHECHPFSTMMPMHAPFRVLTAAETLAYLAWQERSVEHPTIMIALLEDCIQEIPRMVAADASDGGEGEGEAADAAARPGGDSPGSVGRRRDSHRRRSLSLIAQKGSQMMRAAQERGGTPTTAWLEEAWALLAAAAVQFRRCDFLPPPPPRLLCRVPCDRYDLPSTILPSQPRHERQATTSGCPRVPVLILHCETLT